jgi:hypothetical protein
MMLSLLSLSLQLLGLFDPENRDDSLYILPVSHPFDAL